MGVGSIYCAKVFQVYQGQEVLNVYFYRQTVATGPDGSQPLFEAIDINILVEQMGCVNDQLAVVSMEVFDPFIPSNSFAGVPVNNQGTRAVTAAAITPAFVSLAFRSARAGPGTRRSFKRYAGLNDEDYQGNVLDGVFLAIPSVALLQGALGQSILNTAADNAYVPIQVKHPVPLGILPVENYPLTTWLTPYLTTQVSRRLT